MSRQYEITCTLHASPSQYIVSLYSGPEACSRVYTDNSVFTEDWARREEWEAIAHDHENAGGQANSLACKGFCGVLTRIFDQRVGLGLCVSFMLTRARASHWRVPDPTVCGCVGTPYILSPCWHRQVGPGNSHMCQMVLYSPSCHFLTPVSFLILLELKLDANWRVEIQSGYYSKHTH